MYSIREFACENLICVGANLKFPTAQNCYMCDLKLYRQFICKFSMHVCTCTVTKISKAM